MSSGQLWVCREALSPKSQLHPVSSCLVLQVAASKAWLRGFSVHRSAATGHNFAPTAKLLTVAEAISTTHHIKLFASLDQAEARHYSTGSTCLLQRCPEMPSCCHVDALCCGPRLALYRSLFYLCKGQSQQAKPREVKIGSRHFVAELHHSFHIMCLRVALLRATAQPASLVLMQLLMKASMAPADSQPSCPWWIFQFG